MADERDRIADERERLADEREAPPSNTSSSGASDSDRPSCGSTPAKRANKRNSTEKPPPPNAPTGPTEQRYSITRDPPDIYIISLSRYTCSPSNL